jgi:hypothetical protein
MDGRPTREQVKAVIERLAMSHQQVADELGVSRSAVDKWTGKAESRAIPWPCWTLLLLLADKHPAYRLTRRRSSPRLGGSRGRFRLVARKPVSVL